MKPLKKLARSVAKRLLAFGESPPAPLPPEILRIRAANSVVVQARFRCIRLEATDLKLYIDKRDALVSRHILRPDGAWDDAATNEMISVTHLSSGSTHIDLVACS